VEPYLHSLILIFHGVVLNHDLPFTFYYIEDVGAARIILKYITEKL
jgi:hypothetical protein